MHNKIMNKLSREERTKIIAALNQSKIPISYIKRQNLTIRMNMRIFTKLINALFQRKQKI